MTLVGMMMQMIIDLKDNLLRCGEHSVPFLGEGDIPRHLREDAPEEVPSPPRNPSPHTLHPTP